MQLAWRFIYFSFLLAGWEWDPLLADGSLCLKHAETLCRLDMVQQLYPMAPTLTWWHALVTEAGNSENSAKISVAHLARSHGHAMLPPGPTCKHCQVRPLCSQLRDRAQAITSRWSTWRLCPVPIAASREVQLHYIEPFDLRCACCLKWPEGWLMSVTYFSPFPTLRSVTPVLFHATDATLNSKPSSAPKLFHAISIRFVFAEPVTCEKKKCSRCC